MGNHPNWILLLYLNIVYGLRDLIEPGSNIELVSSDGFARSKFKAVLLSKAGSIRSRKPYKSSLLLTIYFASMKRRICEMKARKTEKLINNYITPFIDGYCTKGTLVFTVPINYILRGFSFDHVEGMENKLAIRAFAMLLYTHIDYIAYDYLIPVTVDKCGVKNIVLGNFIGNDCWTFEENELTQTMSILLERIKLIDQYWLSHSNTE